MGTLRIERKIDSTTVTIPELSEFMGQTVEIVVSPRTAIRETSEAAADDRWKPLRDLALDPGDFDFEAVEAQRQLDLQEAESHRK